MFSVFGERSERAKAIARIRYGKRGFSAREVRVNHAGEYGALRIYLGQMCVLRSAEVQSVLSEMMDQEFYHFIYFDDLLRDPDYNVRPTLLLPVWHVFGFLLGFCSALMGKKFAMSCTVAVEDVISRHYAEQLIRLDDQSVAEKVSEFLEDELEHKAIASEDDSTGLCCHNLFMLLVGSVCKFAIVASKIF